MIELKINDRCMIHHIHCMSLEGNIVCVASTCMVHLVGGNGGGNVWIFGGGDKEHICNE